MHQILFIHGGGEDGYHADMALKDSLLDYLDAHCKLNYPQMPNKEDEPDFGWVDKIGEELRRFGADGGTLVLVGHSLGASMLLKFISQRKIDVVISGVFLLAAPFWDGDEDWVQGLKLAKGFADQLPRDIPLFFYHCRDDEEVSFADLGKYRKHLCWAQFITLESGGHQFEGKLGEVAKDIRRL